MTVRHMKIFLTVCDQENSVTKAAEVLYMTQPSVSVAIREIEKHYGVRLFDRISRRLYLTQAGKEYRDYASRTMALLDDMEKHFGNWDEQGAVRLGASMTAGACMMPAYVEEFQRRYPGCEVRVTVEASRNLEEKLKSNELDLALVETQVHEENLHAEQYLEDELCVIVPPGKPYSEHMTYSIEELCSQKLILREKGSGTRDIFDRIMDQNDCYPEPVWETASTTALINAVSHGIGISVVPRHMALQAVSKGEVWMAGVKDIRFIQRFYIVWHKDKYINKAMENFMEVVRECG